MSNISDLTLLEDILFTIKMIETAFNNVQTRDNKAKLIEASKKIQYSKVSGD